MSGYRDEYRTVVTGVSSGPEAEIRQAALAILKERMDVEPENRRLRFVDMVPEPDNPFDRDAIKIMADVPELGGRVQIGYVKNSQTLCEFCGAQHERYPSNGCPRCNTKDQLKRVGVASDLASQMREDPNSRWYCEITEITGGTGNKANYGCNIKIAKTWKSKQKSTPLQTADAVEPPEPALQSGPARAAEPQRRQYDFSE